MGRHSDPLAVNVTLCYSQDDTSVSHFDGGNMYRWLAGIVAVASLVFMFQNCGKAGFENQELLGADMSASALDTRLESLPFPYQVSVNQIAHMSCPINGNTSNGFFSWKVGAFDNPSDVPTSVMSIRPAGLQLTSSFITAWNKVAPTYSTALQAEKLKEVLTGLPSVNGMQLQLSFRKINTPRVDLMSLPSGSASPTTSFMPVLSSSAVASAFISSPGDVINIFPEATDFSNRFLETSVIVPSAYGTQDAALRANYDSSFLTLGFLNPSTTTSSATSASTVLASGGTDDRYAYGKGYRIRFGVTNAHQRTSLYPSSDSLVLVEEYDLDTGYATQGVSWDCSYRFKIVRPEDRFKPYYRANHFNLMSGVTLGCPTRPVESAYCASSINSIFGIHPSYFGGTCPSNRTLVASKLHCEEQYAQTCPYEPYTQDTSDPHPINWDDGIYHPSHPERPAILHALRRFLPADQWDVNVSRRCIVPKFSEAAACYSQTPVYDEYFFTASEAATIPGSTAAPQYTGCGVSGQYPCAAYLTLCVRR